MKRKKLSKGKDRRVFIKTADRTKVTNLNSGTVMRGGIRL